MLPCLFILSIIYQSATAVSAQEPSISFIDGHGTDNICRTRLERKITGLSGMIYSHAEYGVQPYNTSKNCFVIITAPLGYKVRLRVIDFDILGHGMATCDKDTLHVFDHETAVDPTTYQYSTDDYATPGAIIGQFCGRLNGTQEIAVSSMNALTLWWHTDALLGKQQKGKGFRITWNAFREQKSVPCKEGTEFACGSEECLPIALACNRMADCRDGSDLKAYRQAEAKCENLDLDPLSTISGLSVLLLSAVAVLAVVCCCFMVCSCCRFCSTSSHTETVKGKEQCAEAQDLRGCAPRPRQTPYPPAFQPPSPPKLPLPRPQNQQQTRPNVYVPEIGRMRLDYNHGSHGEYACVQGDPGTMC